MKKLSLLLGSLLIGLSASAESFIILTDKQDRSAWTISGCSQQEASAGTNSDGDLTRIIDDNVNTYWHSCWSVSHNDFNHFFLIDRGENANTPIYGFGYTPRQTALQGNGFVTECDVYVLNDITGLSTMNGEAAGVKSDAHSSLLTFIEGKTPAGHGSFNYTYNNASNRGESKVAFSAPANGRYILFVATRTNGDSGNNAEKGNPFANCADFCTYDGVSVDLPCNEVFRMKMRANETSNSYVYWDGTNPSTKNATDANAFVPERLWYFKKAGNNQVTLYTLIEGGQKGMQFTTANNSAATLSDNPTPLTLHLNNGHTVHTSNQGYAATGFSLQVSGNAYVNDAQNKLGVWHPSDDRAATDGGSLVTLYSLTDDDIDGATEATDEAKAAAKANKTPENISALFGHYNVSVTVKNGEETLVVKQVEVPKCPKTEFNTADYDGVLTFETSHSGIPTSDLTLTANVADGANLFKLVSGRYRTRWAVSNGSGLTTASGDDASAGDWLLEEPSGEYFKIFSVKDLKYLGAIQDNANPTALVDNTANANLFRLDRHESGGEYIRNKDNNNAFNARGNNVAGWSGADVGSRYFMVYNSGRYEANKTYYYGETTGELNYDYVTPYKAAIDAANALYDEYVVANVDNQATDALADMHAAIENAAAVRFGRDDVGAALDAVTVASDAVLEIMSRSKIDFEVIKAKGAAFIANHGMILSEAALAAWNEAVVPPEAYTDEVVAAVRDAYANLVGACNGVSVTFQHARVQTDYIGLYNGALHRYAEGEGTRVFTLETSGADGFYIRNEYDGRYVKMPGEDNANASLVADRSEASLYTFELCTFNNHVEGSVGVRQVNGVAGREYWHSNNNNNLIRWEAGESSAWIVSVVDAEQAASECYQGALTLVSGLVFGDGVGQYVKSEEYIAAEDVINAGAQTDATPEQLRAAAAAIRSITSFGTLNMPQAGRFYRFANVAANKYLTTAANATAKPTMVTSNAEPNTLETVFYFNGTHLVSVVDGMVMQKGNQRGKTVISDSANVGEYAFLESNLIGKYWIKCTQEYKNEGNYYFLYSGHATLDGGKYPVKPNDDDYGWTLKEVSWLPMPGSENQLVAVNFPVPVSLYAWGNYSVKGHAYGVDVVNNKVVLSQIEGTTIPANTDVVIKFNDNVERDPNTHLVYLQPLAPEEGVENNVGQFTVNKAEGDLYLGLEGQKFVEETDTIRQGFMAHLPVTEIHEGGFATLTTEAIEAEIDALAGKVFAVKHNQTVDAESEAYRGFLTHNADQDAVWTSRRGNDSDNETAAGEKAQTDPDYQWTLVSKGGKRYLYNIGAAKFAAAYVVKGANGGDAEFVWHFSDYPTAIDFHFYDFAICETLADATFNILGGQNKGNNTRPAGMMIMNNNETHPVPAVSGNEAKNGCGFCINIIEGAEVPEGLSEKLAAALEEMEAAYAQADAANIDDHGTVVGYYTSEKLSEFKEAFTQAGEDADAEAKYYAVVRAHNAVTNKQYNEFTHMHAYQLKVGDKFVNATATDPYFELGDFDNEPLSYRSNWRAEVNENGQLMFTHVLGVEVPETDPAAAPRRVQGRETVNQTVKFAATPEYDGLGNVNLKVEGIGTVHVNSLGDDSNGAQTTEIREVEAASERGAEVIYDLQGRRVNKAGHGLYIINGRKVVK